MASTNGASSEKPYFEQQRELLVGEVAQSLENVLQNMNRLNRSLEGVIAVSKDVKYCHGWRHELIAFGSGRKRVQPS